MGGPLQQELNDITMGGPLQQELNDITMGGPLQQELNVNDTLLQQTSTIAGVRRRDSYSKSMSGSPTVSPGVVAPQ